MGTGDWGLGTGDWGLGLGTRQQRFYRAIRAIISVISRLGVAGVMSLMFAAMPLGGQNLQPAAERVLAAARARMGGTAAISAVRSLVTIADCEGPKRNYRTTVRSDRSGAVEFQQDFTNGSTYRIAYEGRRPADHIPRPRRLTQSELANRAEVQGHEVHMIVLAPGTRYGGPDSVRDTVFRGQRAIGVVFHDTLGGPVVEYFAKRDTLPLGFTFPDREVPAPGSVSMVLSEWRRVNGILLPRYAVYWQGGKAYRFRYTSIEINPVSQGDSVRAPAGIPRAGRVPPLPGQTPQ